MQAPQLALSACCILLGIAPAIAYRWLQIALDVSRQGYGALLADSAPAVAGLASGVDAAQGGAVLAPLTVASVLGAMLGLSWLLSRLGGATRRADAPWLCGYAREAEHNRYAAHSFYIEIKRYFGWVGGNPRPQAGRSGDRGEH
jgi:hypothetical protein